MTNEEAIQEMNNGIEENEGTGFYTVQTEAFKVAIKALKKQIPKKPKIIHEKYQRHYNDEYLCPSCGESACTKCGDWFMDYGLNWCDHCGQRLNWE